MSAAGRHSVPDFQLYGDPQRSGLPDLIHVETIKDRSQLYGWEIEPHRHYGLCQIFWFDSCVGIDLDGRSIQTEAPSILLVPPRVVHGFCFSPQVIGTVTTIPMELLRGEDAQAVAQSPPILLAVDTPGFDRLTQALHIIGEEYRSQGSGRERAILALIELSLAWIRRAGQDKQAEAELKGRLGNSEKRIAVFLDLLERSYTNHRSTSAYAAEIGISKAQLTRDCRNFLGRSPLQIIHDRILQEANRKLAYTRTAVTQISDALGFSDTGYFSRFYRQRMGETPSQYRARIDARMIGKTTAKEP
ncbi:MAG: helix-turn-helix domain-containing protein [Rhodospirillales bacterium]|nr:helix-turn-helix domain-containing protein [Rhodospirillales bacterium]